MKNSIFTLLATMFMVLTGSVALADGHYNGQGFSTVVSTTTLEGKTGSITHMIANDFWNFGNAPEDWPTATMATCHYTILIEAGQQAPTSINGVCESVDPDGDATVWLASIDPATGIGTGSLTSGTGKYKGTSAEPTFQTTFQIDAGHSVYDFTW